MIQINPRSPVFVKLLKYAVVSIVSAFLALMLFSCGARKVSKESSKEDIKNEVIDNSVIEKQSESNIKETTTVKTDDKNEIIIEETTYEPKDPSKESFFIEKDGSKTVLNNLKKTTKKTTQKNNTKSQLENNVSESKKEGFKEQKAVKHINESKKENSVKAIDKKQFNPFQLLWLIIPLLIIYIAYRKYNKLPFVPKI